MVGKTKQPRKQRKRIYEGKQHILRKLMHAHLSKELREKYNRRSLRVRVGDTVKIMRGQFAGKEGKVLKVNVSKQFVYIEGIERKKVSGAKAKVGIHPSNLMITKLNLEDKKRIEILNRKGGIKNE